MCINWENVANYVMRFICSPRVKSFTWRLAMMTVSLLTTLLANKSFHWNLTSNEMIVFGLILGEISKALNNMNQGQNHGFLLEEK